MKTNVKLTDILSQKVSDFLEDRNVGPALYLASYGSLGGTIASVSAAAIEGMRGATGLEYIYATAAFSLGLASVLSFGLKSYLNNKWQDKYGTI